MAPASRTDTSAFGLRVHSGWAALVAVAGPLAAPTVLDRRRIELVDRTSPGGVQPFHAARVLPLEDARRLVERSLESATRLAGSALAAAARAVRDQRHQALACCILDSSARPLPELAAVLASHPLVHTAEGELFRQALAAAAAAAGLPVLRVRERQLLDRCAVTLGIAARGLEDHLAVLGRRLGPPWRQDEKLATLAACLALAEMSAGPAGATQPTPA